MGYKALGEFHRIASRKVRPFRAIEPGKLGKFDHLLLKTAFSSIQRFLEFSVSTFITAI